MIGPLAASVWCWTIIVLQGAAVPSNPQRRWTSSRPSGPDVRSNSPGLAERRRRHGLVVRGRDAEWKRRSRPPTHLSSACAGAHRKGARRLHRARGRTAGIQSSRTGDGRIRRSVRRPVRHGLGHHDLVPLSIAASKNTSLAVVAPGIAEALFATAIGLFAAIPALIASQQDAGRRRQTQRGSKASRDEFSAILSRQIDQHAGDRAA